MGRSACPARGGLPCFGMFLITETDAAAIRAIFAKRVSSRLLSTAPAISWDHRQRVHHGQIAFGPSVFCTHLTFRHHLFVLLCFCTLQT